MLLNSYSCDFSFPYSNYKVEKKKRILSLFQVGWYSHKKKVQF